MRLAPGDPDSVEIRFFDSRRPRHRRQSIQRKIERLLYREDFRRAFARRHRRHRLPAPVARVLHRRAGAQRRRRPRLRERAFKVVLDYSYGAASIVMPIRAGEARRRGARGEPVREHACRRPPGDPEEQVARIADARAGVGQRARVRDRPRRRAGHDHRRRRPRRSSPMKRCSRSCALVAEARARRARSRCRSSVTQEAERIAAERGAEIVWTKLADASLMEVAASDGRHVRRRRPTAGSSGPTSSLRSTPPATLVKLLDLLAASRPAAVRRSCATLPVGPHRARDGRHAVGAQGRGDARDRGAASGPRTSCSSTA